MAGLICAGCWVVARSGETPEPNVAEWIAAISTAGALLAAGAAAIIAWRVHVHNQRTQRAEQASKVAAWIEWRDTGFDKRGLARAGGWRCVLLNSSALPVYDVMIIYLLLGEPRDIYAGTSREELVAPGEKVVQLPEHVRREQHRLHHDTRQTIRVEIQFTDSTGRRWWRGRDGVLTDKEPRKTAPPEPETQDDQG